MNWWELAGALLVGGAVVVTLVTKLLHYFLLRSYEEVVKSIDLLTQQLVELTKEITAQNKDIALLAQWRVSIDRRIDILQGRSHKLRGLAAAMVAQLAVHGIMVDIAPEFYDD